MTDTLAVLWTIGSPLHTGRLDIVRGRIELRSRRHVLSIPLDSITAYAIERGPSVRIRGLPVLRIELTGGLFVRIASLESVMVLADLADKLAGRHPMPA
jgi:hypothetical protein